MANYNLDSIGFPIYSLGRDLSKYSIISDGVYQIDCDGFYLDILIEGLERLPHKYCIVCFTAAVTSREDKIGPFFSGRSISKKLHMPLISIADPLVSKCDLNIAWYAGGESQVDLQDKIALALKKIKASLHVDFLFIGGSGAGFASLANLMVDNESSHKALIWNPQTSIVEYFYGFVKQYMLNGFPEEMKSYMNPSKHDFLDILNKHKVTSILDDTKISEKHQYLYLQNYSDSHFKDHMQPYVNRGKKWERVGESSFINHRGNAGLYVGNWDGVHAPPPESMLIYLAEKILKPSSTVFILQDLEKNYVSFKNNTLPVEIYNDKCFWGFSFLIENNQLKVRTYFTENNLDCEYAFYLTRNDKRIKHVYYTLRNSHVFDLSDLSNWNDIGIRAYIRLTSGQVFSQEKELLSKE